MNEADSTTLSVAVVILGCGWLLLRILQTGVLSIKLGFGQWIDVHRSARPIVFMLGVGFVSVLLMGAILYAIWHVSLHYL